LRPTFWDNNLYFPAYYSIEKEKKNMKSKISEFTIKVSQINPQYVRLAWILLALSMMALGAGAPADGGGGIPR